MAESLENPPKLHKIDAAPERPAKVSSWRDRFASERRHLADAFARERLVEMLKQLAWVVPLTLLIWVYAEREQVTKETNETIPFELLSPDPDRLVTLTPPQDSNIVVELEGPRARVQDVLQRLRGGEFPQGLRIQVDPALEPNREHQLPTINLIANHDLFRRNGITVTRTQPDTINVTVDKIVEREAQVEPAPGTDNRLDSVKFNPPTVKIRGPLNVLERGADRSASVGGPPGVGNGNGRTLVVYALVPEKLLATPGTRVAEDLDLTLPPPLAEAEHVSIIPPQVDATLQVRAADEEWVMPSMTVTLDQPKTVADQYTVKYDTSLFDVKLIGPKDIISEMKKPEGPKPYAQLRVTIEDANRGPLRRTLRFMDLPDRVRVDEKDRQREVQFELIPRSDVVQ